ncbi:uncharacterized protein GIQ15_04331 [Arthroderma uncinatum]|uniref:uncharacterized protein n=1 Tax=Arthroderma uncinatum TaxID=74035 RepID=UPI00144AE957|nr:uncharacterized protein GIQ15_04331 [Arthroderma uncinatum]KAF3481572.1 hypothetical protein GIQ15_04331 [Arthroderma uncinatum]
MPAYRLSESERDTGSNPHSFKVFWSVVDKEGTVLLGNSKHTWYKLGDESLYREPVAQVMEVVGRANIAVNAAYLIEIPSFDPTDPTLFKCGVKQQACLRKAFLSRVQSSGVEKFLKWKKWHEARVNGSPDKTCDQQYTEYDEIRAWQDLSHEFDDDFCQRAFESRDCLGARLVDGEIASEAMALRSKLQEQLNM